MLYAIALVKGDAAAMQQQVERVAGTPAEPGMLSMQSVAAAHAGGVGQARQLTKRAIELARNRDLEESAGLFAAGDALWEAAYGNCQEGKNAAARSLALSRGRYALSWNALAVAMCGDSLLANKLAGEMVARFPQDSFFKASWLPMIHAALLLQRRDPGAAVEQLQTAARVELGTNASLWPAYLRGLAYLDQDAVAEARVEFKKILDHKGVLIPKDFNPAALTLYPLAYLGTARAAARAGDVDAARSAYESLFGLWQAADSDLDIVRAARREYRQLQAARTGQPRSPKQR
jgi:hypothetical protein